MNSSPSRTWLAFQAGGPPSCAFDTKPACSRASRPGWPGADIVGTLPGTAPSTRSHAGARAMRASISRCSWPPHVRHDHLPEPTMPNGSWSGLVRRGTHTSSPARACAPTSSHASRRGGRSRRPARRVGAGQMRCLSPWFLASCAPRACRVRRRRRAVQAVSPHPLPAGRPLDHGSIDCLLRPGGTLARAGHLDRPAGDIPAVLAASDIFVLHPLPGGHPTRAVGRRRWGAHCHTRSPGCDRSSPTARMACSSRARQHGARGDSAPGRDPACSGLPRSRRLASAL